ncbi:hypothetical protein [Reichenbachiella versicolor]|uniref:hypothetical protein n=1 Tax=Reichenbachiella versicolor TaxID=1821036 RepID=UPI000D6E8E5E|nr:hypothetical protein [Reichenbachiella versicolor]
MNRRFLGIVLTVVFVVLSGSGLFLYFTPHTTSTASLHTFFGLLFLIAILFHILNNKLPLTSYITGKGLSNLKKLISPLILVVLVVISLAVYYNLPVFDKLYSWGNELRNTQIGKEEVSFDYEIIDLDQAVGNRDVSVEFKKGVSFRHPIVAIWLEDTAGNYIQTLYVSKHISTSTFQYGKRVGDTWEPAIVRRPEALPYWSHKRGIKAPDGLYIPLEGAPDIDGVSGATPQSNWIINSKGNLYSDNNYSVLVEFNQSFDWNEYYSKTRFPEDEIYSGSGAVGQPSLIYASEISSTDLVSTTHKIMNLIGHGHHSGKDGKLYKDLSNITTAKNIADRIILTVK